MKKFSCEIMTGEPHRVAIENGEPYRSIVAKINDSPICEVAHVFSQGSPEGEIPDGSVVILITTKVKWANRVDSVCMNAISKFFPEANYTVTEIED